MTLTIGRQIGAGFALVLLLFAVVAGVAVLQMNAMQRETSRIEAANPLDAAARDILTELLNEETAVRGYVATGKPLFLDRYRQGRTALPQDLAYIASNDAEYPQLRRTVDGIGPTIGRIDSFFAREIALVAGGKRAASAAELVTASVQVSTASEQSSVAVEQISQAIHSVAVAARQQSVGVSAVRVSVEEVASTSAQIAHRAAG